jgi:signal transduction histidine kinase/CheY-like chemotaxis protein
LERKCRNLLKTWKEEYTAGTEDTIKIIENHLAILLNTSRNNNPGSDLDLLANLVKEKISYVKSILVVYKNNNKDGVIKLIESMQAEDKKETIYSSALKVQQTLEDNLKKSLSQSSGLSKKVLRLDKILSIVAILAIVILGTTIIKRLLEQLKLINKLALEKERADKSALIKEQFLANMSHEIRTPINAVVGFSNLLQKTPLQNEQKQFVDLIQKSGENLLSVVNDILDISKLEAGMMSITKNPFSIRDTCLSLEMMFYHKATEKNISFFCQIDESIPDTLVGDAERLNQVLINLINNAIKFTSEGEVNVKIEMKKKATDKVELVFSVKDTGIGIPANKQLTIFERFEQVDSDTSRQYGGTGLGLAIVKKIINLQGGDIVVKSEEGKGSDFIFNIIYNYIENPENLKVFTDIQNQDEIKFNNIKALVAEDNVTNQTLLKFTLKQWNLDYDLAENGKHALALIKQNKYDIVLMDIQMPEMDGYEAARQIRKEVDSKIPIIAMTAHVLPSEREKCINSGMNDYISKPLKESEFLKLLKKYLPFSTAKTENTVVQNKLKNEYRYIDLDYLNNIFPGNEKFINEIMYEFREQYPKEIRMLKFQVENENLEGVKGLAHHLKTTVSSLSIDTPLRIHLDKIEEFAKDEDWSKIQKEVDALVQKEDFVLKEVNTIITSR